MYGQLWLKMVLTRKSFLEQQEKTMIINTKQTKSMRRKQNKEADLGSGVGQFRKEHTRGQGERRAEESVSRDWCFY